MPQKRLDEEFTFPSDRPLLDDLRRFVRQVEARLQPIEAKGVIFQEEVEKVRDVGLDVIQDALVEPLERVRQLSSLGFLVAYSTTSILMQEDLQRTFVIPPGPGRDYFAPTKFVAIEKISDLDVYGIAEVLSYSPEYGELVVIWRAVFGGNAGPHTDWIISNTTGAAGAVRHYHDQIVAMRAEVQADRAIVDAAMADIEAAMVAIENGPVASVNGIPGPGVLLYAHQVPLQDGTSSIQARLNSLATDVSSRALTTSVNQALAGKADAQATSNALAVRPTATEVNNALALKANVADVATTADLNANRIWAAALGV